MLSAGPMMSCGATWPSGPPRLARPPRASWPKPSPAPTFPPPRGPPKPSARPPAVCPRRNGRNSPRNWSNWPKRWKRRSLRQSPLNQRGPMNRPTVSVKGKTDRIPPSRPPRSLPLNPKRRRNPMSANILPALPPRPRTFHGPKVREINWSNFARPPAARRMNSGSRNRNLPCASRAIRRAHPPTHPAVRSRPRRPLRPTSPPPPATRTSHRPALRMMRRTMPHQVNPEMGKLSANRARRTTRTSVLRNAQANRQERAVMRAAPPSNHLQSRNRTRGPRGQETLPPLRQRSSRPARNPPTGSEPRKRRQIRPNPRPIRLVRIRPAMADLRPASVQIRHRLDQSSRATIRSRRKFHRNPSGPRRAVPRSAVPMDLNPSPVIKHRSKAPIRKAMLPQRRRACPTPTQSSPPHRPGLQLIRTVLRRRSPVTPLEVHRVAKVRSLRTSTLPERRVIPPHRRPEAHRSPTR